MTYMDPNDPTRVPTDDPVRRPSSVPDRGGMSVWGFPLIVAAALVILGFVFFGTHERTTTASNNPPATSGKTAPAPAPAPPAVSKQ
ncbi:MAG: hypothetical protein WCE79_12015 [Xanthobacteraceae bacterium]